MPAPDEKQNITLRLSRQTLQKARIIAARRSTSISGLITTQLEELAHQDDDYELAMHRAMARMRKGFHLGEVHSLDRDSLHER
jgi:HSP90 family molecular chaperone